MPQCLDVPAWRIATKDELLAFHEGKIKRKGQGAILIVRTKLTQADVYAYLRTRFGIPNGFQNFLRENSSDNLVHWDFNLRAGDCDVYIQGRMRDVVIVVSEPMSDEDWKSLILSLKADFGRLGPEKSQMIKSFEKFVVFQNKFSLLAGLCAELHESIVDAPPPVKALPRVRTEKSITKYVAATKMVARRATNLYGDCLKLKLLTPIMAEAFINMMIVTLCKPEIRNDVEKYDLFVREKIPQRLEHLSVNCWGFSRPVDLASDACRDFLKVMNARNFRIHGNVDPVREQIETVYFEGKRPLFTDNGDHIFKLFEHLETINEPRSVTADYEAVHIFLAELEGLLAEQIRAFFKQVINDPYPGYEVKAKRVTKVLPSRNAAMLFAGEKWDADLKVIW